MEVEERGALISYFPEEPLGIPEEISLAVNPQVWDTETPGKATDAQTIHIHLKDSTHFPYPIKPYHH
jgi:hypothetical protein